MNPLVTKTLDVARADIGVREIGTSNTGPQVNAWLKRAGVGPSNSWCCAFVYSEADEAASALGVRNPIPRTAYCPNVHNWAKELDLTLSKPKAGCIFLRVGEIGGVFRAHHIGFVDTVNLLDTSFTTVEGNTNDTGSSNGIGVFSLTRSYGGGGYVFVDWERACDETTDKPYTLSDTTGHLMPVDPMNVIDGRAMVNVREFGAALGSVVSWSQDAQAPTFDGKVLPVQISKIEGHSFAPVRDVALAVGLSIIVDSNTRKIQLFRPVK